MPSAPAVGVWQVTQPLASSGDHTKNCAAPETRQGMESGQQRALSADSGFGAKGGSKSRIWEQGARGARFPDHPRVAPVKGATDGPARGGGWGRHADAFKSASHGEFVLNFLVPWASDCHFTGGSVTGAPFPEPPPPAWVRGLGRPPPPCVTFRRVVVSLRGPGQSPVLPFTCCVGALRSVGRCGRCSCWCRFRVRGAQYLVCRGCAGCGGVCRLRVSGAQ